MIELKNIDVFKKGIEAISSFIPEGNFRFSDKGIYFKSIDPSQIVLVDYYIDKSIFSKYSIESNYVGVDLVELNKIIQRADLKDTMFLNLENSELKIKFVSELKRSFRLPLIDIKDSDIKLPEINYKTLVEISAVSLKEVLKDANLFGTSVVLKVEDSKFFIQTSGSQGVMDSDLSSVSKINSKENVACKFSLSFLQNIVKECENFEKVILELKTDSAVKISFKIGSTKIVFYLAHMIL
jgi:proliferating cell nuclear antigen